MKKSRYLLCLLALLSLGLFPALSPQGSTAKPRINAAHQAARSNALLKEKYEQLPIRFEANEGQTDPQVKFLARGSGYTSFLTRDQLVISLQNPSRYLNAQNRSTSAQAGFLQVKLLGANAQTRMSGVRMLPGVSNYYIGKNPREWHTGVPNYGGVQYTSIYPGVDLLFHSRGHDIEYDFVVAPGASASAPHLRLQGSEQIRLDTEGNLVLQLHHQEFKFLKPVAYQETCHTGTACRRTVQVSYHLAKGNEVAFNVGAFDHSLPLVIDPVLKFATYLGGAGGDVAYGVATDSSGRPYIVGVTGSTNFLTSNPEQKAIGGDSDAFIAKMDPSGATLMYSTYLGGNGVDSGSAIAVDSAGDAYVTGSTSSANFPTTAGVLQPSFNSSATSNGFVAKLGPAGGTLTYCTYLGGSGSDFGQGIAVDGSGNAYITGSTTSFDFPTVTPLQGGNDGSSDAFVAKLNSNGTALIYSTFLGGSSADSGQAIALDSASDAYVAGYTFSSNFPTANPVYPSSHGNADAFVSEVNPAGTSLVFSTYLGGSGIDHAYGIALDSSGNIYVAGDTQSADFPASSGAFQTTNNGSGDAFVAKFSPSGAALVYATLLGGSNTDRATAVAVDSSGDAYVTGFTVSSDFPTVQAFQPNFGGGICGAASACPDAFVTEVNPQGSGLVYSSYLGGGGADFGQGIALGTAGDPIVVGATFSGNFPVIAGAIQGAYNGSSESTNAFIAQVDPANSPSVAMTPQNINFGNQAINTKSPSQTVTIMNAGTAPLSISSVTPNTDFGETNNCAATTLATGQSCTITITFTPTTLGPLTESINIADNTSVGQHEITVSGTGISATGAVTLSAASVLFPDQVYGTTSAAKNVTVTNTGNGTLDFASFTPTGDFAETNTCGTSLAVNASCVVSITFTPTGTGSRTGSVSIADDATNTPQAISLTGTGDSNFSLSATSNSSTVLIGAGSAKFTVQAAALSAFTGSITLACASGPTCAFNPASVSPGGTSTLTVSGLTSTTANPDNITVNGTNGSQTASLPLAVFFSDFAVSASPPLDTVAPGTSATYTVTITPLNGFNQAVLLSCSMGLPTGSACSFSPSSVSPSGSPVNSTVTVTTTAQSASVPPVGKWPLFPGNWRTPLLIALLAWLLAVILAGLKARRSAPAGTPLSRRQLRFAAGSLLGTVLLTILLAACNNQTNGSTTTPVGSSAGNFTITIRGALGSDNTIARHTTVNLTVN